MTTTRTFWRLAKLPLAVSLASAIATPAYAVNFNIGEIEGQVDSSLSVGASWSMRGADPDLIGKNNGGKGLSQTSDDGHLNFKKGETFSKIFKDIDDHGRKEGAQSSGAQILDAFVYHNYDIAEQPGSVRLGKQVVSWGESTFIQNSINAVNPVDVSAFRRPGAEVKEGLIPVNMFFVQQSLTENLSAEAFYQLEWDQTVVDNCGTFFSQADIAADGCTQNLAVLSNVPAAIAGVNGLLPAAYDVTASPWKEGIVVRRYGDKDARDSGQFGTAFRYFFEPLDTEFGAYFMNYHSRAPIFSGQGASAQAQATINGTASAVATTGGFSAAKLTSASSFAAAATAGNGGYFMEYPEDIQLYGVSFSSTLPTGTAWSGEVSYRPNAPVQINSTDILYAGLDAIAINTGVPGLGEIGRAS